MSLIKPVSRSIIRKIRRSCTFAGGKIFRCAKQAYHKLCYVADNGTELGITWNKIDNTVICDAISSVFCSLIYGPDRKDYIPAKKRCTKQNDLYGYRAIRKLIIKIVSSSDYFLPFRVAV